VLAQKAYSLLVQYSNPLLYSELLRGICCRKMIGQILDE
jgi:hypothetical protein